jgi:prepilin-type N-terminal cleavage/methylation domain-containing protein
MKILLRIILKSKLKNINVRNSGFTLIELLVALILAVLIITPLMGFMVDVLGNERKEQAKTTTSQEIQTAIDFIQRDLQQAVYIYDNDGLNTNTNTTPLPGDGTIPPSGIKNQIPPSPSKPIQSCDSTTTCTPVLVFWKREFLSESVGVSSPTDTNRDDGFAYSLVGYYLINNSTGTNTTWSRSARIARFQIRGMVSSANRTSDKGGKRSKGYNPPPLDLTIPGAKLKDKMNRWQAIAGENYSDSSTVDADQVKILTLVDYISETGPDISCPPGSQQTGNNVGFYACVDADNVIAQVSITGNAFKRLDKNNSYSANDNAYFPTSTIRVQGRGFLFVK